MGLEFSAVTGVAGSTIFNGKLTCTYIQVPNGTTISNSVIDGMQITGASVTLSGCTVTCTENVTDAYWGGYLRPTGMFILNNCSFTRNPSSNIYYISNPTRAVVTNCTFGFIREGNWDFSFVNTYVLKLINTVIPWTAGSLGTAEGNSLLYIKGSTLSNGLDVRAGKANTRQVVDGYNKLTKNGYMRITAVDTGTVYLISGSTVHIDNTWLTGHIINAPAVKVGTFTDTTDYTDSSFTTGGTATVITNSGSTVKVSGTGTYIDKDGITDLTIVS